MTTRTGTFTTCSLIALAAFSAVLAGGLLYADGAMAKGKPAPGPGAGADPVLVTIDNKVRLVVANEDGSAKTVLPTDATPRLPIWSPLGDGTTTPYHIIYEVGCSGFRVLDVTVTTGTPTASNDRPPWKAPPM